ncbi:MAG: hypothetical protein AAGD38_01230 [Acidobacteriota bacterium]
MATYTFEDIDRHIDALELTSVESHSFTTEAIEANPLGVLKEICKVYRAIQPILDILRNLPLIPEKWRNVIGIFITLMDNICPEG